MLRLSALLLLAGAIICARSGSAAADKAARPPNIVFILADDLGWMDTAVYGSRFYETPNIDRLAAEGMRFTDAYAAAAVCSPTRASVLTGLYPARLHLTNITGGTFHHNARLLEGKSIDALPLDVLTIPKALHRAGYVSASFGKWHLGDEREHWPDRQGFDVCDPVPPHPCPADSEDCDPKGINQLTDKSCQFMETNRDRPFFLYLGHFAVHTPIEARPSVVSRYATKVQRGAPQRNPNYAAMVDELDRGIGRLAAKIDELGLRQNTVVFIMSDNGGTLTLHHNPKKVVTSNLPLRDGKESLYEGGVREPMIVRWPGHIRPGSVANVPVSSIDFLPTIVALAGLPLPTAPAVDGVSLVPLLTGARNTLPPRPLFWHYPHYHFRPPASSVRDGEWKLIEFYEDEHVELYNLRDDLGEHVNLARREQAKAAQLREQLHQWLASCDAAMPRLNPHYSALRATLDKWSGRLRVTRLSSFWIALGAAGLTITALLASFFRKGAR